MYVVRIHAYQRYHNHSIETKRFWLFLRFSVCEFCYRLPASLYFMVYIFVRVTMFLRIQHKSINGIKLHHLGYCFINLFVSVCAQYLNKNEIVTKHHRKTSTFYLCFVFFFFLFLYRNCSKLGGMVDIWWNIR